MCLLGAIAPENPQAQAWAYTDEARLRGLIQKADPLDAAIASVVRVGKAGAATVAERGDG
ncbi:hypothetical protein [Laspinema olomoucense]|uniref:hypothetical protein n=1 Tax=Laspinema olomoucense TaxID=3231600 RepID=UPI0021BB1318|nr:hypothetical protein [Laspinema sp. D3d]